MISEESYKLCITSNRACPICDQLVGHFSCIFRSIKLLKLVFKASISKWVKELEKMLF